MELPKIDVQRESLPNLLNNISTGQLQVPRFQRDFVWPLTKTRALLDSMYKEFPIGTFFMWRSPTGTPPLTRPLSELGIPAPQPGVAISYILDGQQRLTSLYCAIKGIRIGSRNYGRVCIDLEVATRYELTKEEDFNEDIFVYRTNDNFRYVAVKDLVGEKSLMIFDQIPKDWKPAYNKAYNLFRNYPFSVVWIQDQILGNAIEIFQRINQAGQRLSRYDLVCANIWRQDFDFRKRVNDLNRKFELQGFGKIDETIYTQTFSLIINDQCTTAAELSLQTDQIVKVWDDAIKALGVAVEFAVQNLGVKRTEYLPYRGLLVVLTYFFYHAKSAISAKDREVLWNWFWRVTLSERYSSTSPLRMAEDAKKLRSHMKGDSIKFNYLSTVTSDSVLRTKMSSTSSALRNATLCMLAIKKPRNFKDGSLVNLSDNFFSNLKQAERHHVFPVGYLKTISIDPRLVHLLPNFCFIPADLNKEIGSQAPSKYMARYKGTNPQFALALESHLIPNKPNSSIYKDDFDGFLKERAQLIADELNSLLEGGPMDLQPVVGEAPLSDVDIMEIRFREFIDHRLSGMIGENYWKKTMPGDVITYVKAKIDERLSYHPYETQSQYASGRSRLDFCDVAHYEKIILKNWDLFTEYFKRKDEFQRHMTAFRTLRNCIQHNRKPSDIEQKNGEAAILWHGRILDNYEQEITDIDKEDGEDVVDDLDDDQE